MRLALAFLLLSTPVLAEPKRQKRQQATSELPSAGASADARAKRHSFGALRAGNFMGGITGTGFDAGYIHDAARQFFLHVMAGTADLKDQVKDDAVVTLDHFEARGLVVKAAARFFFGNSFHVTGGVGLRRVGFDMELVDRASTGSVTTRAEARSVVISLDVGNVWAWDNGFFLGADWIGYSQPLTSSYRSSVETEGTASGAIHELSDIVDDSARDLGSLASTQFLVLDVGFMF